MTASDARAVLVGVASYKNVEFEPLSCAPHDLALMERLLESHADGSENFEVTSMMLDEHTPESAADILATVDREITEAVNFVFYFSGHGHFDDFGLQLLTAEKLQRLDGGIYFDTLLHRFNRERKTEITVILDCCFSGAAGNSSVDHLGGLHVMTQLRDGISILASSSAHGESFAEEDSASDFTAAVGECLESLDGGAVTVLDLYKWTSQRLTDQTSVLRTFGSSHTVLRAASRQTAGR